MKNKMSWEKSILWKYFIIPLIIIACWIVIMTVSLYANDSLHRWWPDVPIVSLIFGYFSSIGTIWLVETLVIPWKPKTYTYKERKKITKSQRNFIESLYETRHHLYIKPEHRKQGR